MITQNRNSRIQKNIKLVKSTNPFKSVIQTNYDIVKSHGVELKVETKEGEGSEFIIQLPIKNNQ